MHIAIHACNMWNFTVPLTSPPCIPFRSRKIFERGSARPFAGVGARFSYMGLVQWIGLGRPNPIHVKVGVNFSPCSCHCAPSPAPPRAPLPGKARHRRERAGWAPPRERAGWVPRRVDCQGRSAIRHWRGANNTAHLRLRTRGKGLLCFHTLWEVSCRMRGWWALCQAATAHRHQSDGSPALLFLSNINTTLLLTSHATTTRTCSPHFMNYRRSLVTTYGDRQTSRDARAAPSSG
jgi:hypothetical protein